MMFGSGGDEHQIPGCKFVALTLVNQNPCSPRDDVEFILFMRRLSVRWNRL